MRKGQGRKTLLDAHGLRAPRRHCITHRHDSVIDITKWAQEYFQKPLSVNTIRYAICKCQLKLYHTKSKPYVNIVQKHCRVLCPVSCGTGLISIGLFQSGKVFYGQTSPNLTFLLEITDAVSSRLKRMSSAFSLKASISEGMGSLHVLEGTMNGERYIKVLEQTMLPSR